MLNKVNNKYIQYTFISGIIILAFSWHKYTDYITFESSSGIKSNQSILTSPDEERSNPVVSVNECEENSTNTNCNNTPRSTLATDSANIQESTSSKIQIDADIQENSPYPTPQTTNNTVPTYVSTNIKLNANVPDLIVETDLDNPQFHKTYFDFEAPLKIENIAPPYGPSGEIYDARSTIIGTGFMKEGNIINFGSVKIHNVKSYDGTMINLVVPKIIPGSDPQKPEYFQAGNYLVSVTTDTATSKTFTYTLKTPETLASESSCTISARKQSIVSGEEVFLEWTITGQVKMFFVDNNINQDIYKQEEWQYKMGESNG